MRTGKSGLKAALLAALIMVSSQPASSYDMLHLMSDDSKEATSVFYGISGDVRNAMLNQMKADNHYVGDDEHFTYLGVDSLTMNYVKIDFADTNSETLEVFIINEIKNPLILSIANFGTLNDDAIVKAFDGKTLAPVSIQFPEYSDWLVKGALTKNSEAALLAAIPFITYKATVDEKTGNIVLTNTSILTPGLNPEIADSFIPEIVLKWNGKSLARK